MSVRQQQRWKGTPLLNDPQHFTTAVTARSSAWNSVAAWFSRGTQCDGFAEHVNFALVEMTVLQLPFIVLDANSVQSFPCQSGV